MRRKDLKNNFPYKLGRKINCLFWDKLRCKKCSLFFFTSYRHLIFTKEKKKADLDTVYLTLEPNRAAGIGHQLGNWLAGYCIAKKMNVKYAYSRFPSVEWDDFLGFGEQEISVEELRKKGYVKRRIPSLDVTNEESVNLIKSIINSYGGKKVILFLTFDQFYRDIQEAELDIKEKFNHAPARKSDKLLYDSENLNIAVHIRRGDIVAGQSTLEVGLTKRWLDNDYYVALLRDTIECIPKGKNYQIYIFSQGCREDFLEFNEFENINFCFDMSARDTFLHMVRADILLTSKSSFSYKPALLSDGIKIVPKHFWHGYPTNDSKWIIIDEEKDIVSDKQLEKLRKIISESIK